MKKNILVSVVATMMLLFISSNGNAQNAQKVAAKTTTTSLEVIQFHSEHRCMTCNKIEELSRETLKSFTNVPFKLVNVDDSKNEKLAEQFQATGTSLYLYNSKTKKIKNLTDFAFSNAFDKNRFVTGLKKEINAFK